MVDGRAAAAVRRNRRSFMLMAFLLQRSRKLSIRRFKLHPEAF